MTCYYPRKIYPTETTNQKSSWTFERPSGHSGNHKKVPCKICIGCRLDHRTDWATRMMHEATFHQQSSFVTFTYNNENLPKNGDLVEEHMRNFFKRLRKKLPYKIRYVYSGEYGKKTSRPHYHAIIFGFSLPDQELVGSNDRGEPLYASEWLDGIWGYGETKTGAVTHQSCGYVAGYMLKDSLKTSDYYKKDSDGNSIPYSCLDTETGELIERPRPFARYSNRPGIGRKWIEKYYTDVFKEKGDCVRVIQDGKIQTRPTPQYYVDVLKKLDPALWAQVVENRENAVIDPKNKNNSTPERLAVREICLSAKVKLKKRGSPEAPENKIFVNI